MPKLDLDAIELTNRTGYPPPYAEQMSRRHFRRVGPAAGLVDFGVSHVVLQPGGISSQRHWHEGEDEFVVMLEGEAVLVEEGEETVMRVGDCAAFPKGSPTGIIWSTEASATACSSPSAGWPRRTATIPTSTSTSTRRRAASSTRTVPLTKRSPRTAR